jgi:hypothetical protein
MISGPTESGFAKLSRYRVGFATGFSMKIFVGVKRENQSSNKTWQKDR